MGVCKICHRGPSFWRKWRVACRWACDVWRSQAFARGAWGHGFTINGAIWCVFGACFVLLLKKNIFLYTKIRKSFCQSIRLQFFY